MADGGRGGGVEGGRIERIGGGGGRRRVVGGGGGEEEGAVGDPDSLSINCS